MTPEELLTNGCRVMHWNPNWNGGWFEYWLPIECDAEGNVYSRLSVRFNKNLNSGRAWMVFIGLPQFSFALKHILTIEQFLQMHRPD